MKCIVIWKISSLLLQIHVNNSEDGHKVGQKIHGKHVEPSRADTTPEKMKSTYSTYINRTCGWTQRHGIT
jgi:hypothetical protein